MDGRAAALAVLGAWRFRRRQVPIRSTAARAHGAVPRKPTRHGHGRRVQCRSRSAPLPAARPRNSAALPGSPGVRLVARELWVVAVIGIPTQTGMDSDEVRCDGKRGGRKVAASPVQRDDSQSGAVNRHVSPLGDGGRVHTGPSRDARAGLASDSPARRDAHRFGGIHTGNESARR